MTAATDVLMFGLDVALRGVVLAAIVALALAVFRVSSAAVRLSAWTIVLLSALAMPLAARVLPPMTFAIPAPIDRLLPQRATPAPPSTSSVNQSADPSRTSLPGTASPAADSSRLAALASSWPVWGLGLYLCVATALLLRGAASWRLAIRLERDASFIHDADARNRLRRLAARAGLAQVPALAESAVLRVPVATSVLAPAILLPPTWQQWSPARLDAVLAHELSHIARHDVLIQRASLVYRALVWPSPFSWWLHRHLAELAELASDEAALEAGADRTDYAETLVAFFAELRQADRFRTSTVAMARDAAAIAERRLDRILRWKGDRSMKLTRRLVLVLVLAAAPVVAQSAARRPAVTPAPATTAATPATPAVTPAPTLVQSQAQQAPPPPPAPARRQVPPPPPIPAPARVLPPPPPPPPPPSQADQEFGKGAYAADTVGLTPPTGLRSVEPKYTSDAMRAKLQGVVDLDVVVNADGSVADARVAKDQITNPLADVNGWRPERQVEQLEAEALKAVRQWTFTPGRLDGKAVPVVVQCSLTFRLH